MRRVNLFVEKGDDGTYGVYIDLEENKLTYGIIGEGRSAKEAIDDFHRSYAEMKELYKEEGKRFEEVEFVLKYDLPSFLQYYSKILSLAGMERLTGVNQTQLSHYISGFRKPSKKTSEKIESALHSLGKELCQVEFV
ncbi:MAG: helix-turn-helix domain-containing protein [Bacteroidales bacterium]